MPLQSTPPRPPQRPLPLWVRHTGDDGVVPQTVSVVTGRRPPVLRLQQRRGSEACRRMRLTPPLTRHGRPLTRLQRPVPTARRHDGSRGRRRAVVAVGVVLVVAPLAPPRRPTTIGRRRRVAVAPSTRASGRVVTVRASAASAATVVGTVASCHQRSRRWRRSRRRRVGQGRRFRRHPQPQATELLVPLTVARVSTASRLGRSRRSDQQPPLFPTAVTTTVTCTTTPPMRSREAHVGRPQRVLAGPEALP